MDGRRREAPRRTRANQDPETHRRQSTADWIYPEADNEQCDSISGDGGEGGTQ